MANEIILVAVAGGIGILGGLISTIYQSRQNLKRESRQSKRTWKEQSVSELLGPMFMLLERTNRAFKKWNAHNSFLEAEVMEKSNRKIRDLLLEKASLIPPELLTKASDFVAHYDAWLESYDENRIKKSIEEQKPFTFVREGDPQFPKKAEKKFKEVCREYWNELYKQKDTKILDDEDDA